MRPGGINMANFYCAFFHLMCKIPFWPCFFQILGAPSWIKIPWVYARIRAPVQLLSFARLSLSMTCHPCVEFFFFLFFPCHADTCVGHCKKCKTAICFDIPSGKASIFHVGKTCHVSLWTGALPSSS